MKELTEYTAWSLAEGIRAGAFTAQEVARAHLAQIAAAEPQVAAFLTITAGQALAAAEQIDARRAAGETLPPLAGVPMGVKDNLCTEGVPTTCASKMLKTFIPPYTATAVEKAEGAGAVSLGKLNMDEFAMGSSTENSHFQITRNPRDLSRVPGGSSGGAAAAVAAGECAFALGSDTGGSIRQPAAFCGVVGMKPTYGAVSRYGLVAFASSLDQVGPLTRTVRDNALVLNALAGKDSRDATSLDRDWGDFTAQLDSGVEGMRIALPQEYFGQGLSPEIAAAIRAAADTFARLGARVEEVSLPTLEYALPAYYVISSAEASSNLARFDGVKYGYRSPHYSDLDSLYKNTRTEGFGREVKRRILLGSFVLSSGYYDAYYKKAQQVRTLVKGDFDRILGDFDCILSPVAPTTAYKIGEKTADPLQMYLGDVYTVPVNIAGVPALALPCGTDSQGLPIGMQLIGRPFGEGTLYRAGQAFEQEREGERQ
ncbi:Asp-tRNA(Asn)/Glu-tRNA(Gln) amidotransferase subunit GatA [Bittarella massiliensis (ex Durand et al. 2017)]|uniref:Asp-tRNA(Asn)/Glu-tRNA(Gln) amidotransferase subunit GatA n=1 Tax=Bittarella massiliensis (ex Durand et al. 2017) TaxID=1720313 RepID=UPI001AA1140F|nr:Asp-tRNA(Asn)/Glu-tRNA(Gln) amidotransferase subunit GatA [Bittarella massiliensis (ex Durand et al. 2017)]